MEKKSKHQEESGTQGRISGLHKDDLVAKEVTLMGLFDWFRRRRKTKMDEDNKMLERTGKLRTEIMEQVKEKPKRTRKKKKKGSV